MAKAARANLKGMASIMRARSALTGWSERWEVIARSSLELKCIS